MKEQTVWVFVGLSTATRTPFHSLVQLGCLGAAFLLGPLLLDVEVLGNGRAGVPLDRLHGCLETACHLARDAVVVLF